MKKNIDIVVPKYKFAPEQDDLSPVKRTIMKTMEVTETFTFWDVLKYIAKMDKAIQDKQAELDGLLAMKEAYLKELPIIEKQLKVSDMEKAFQKEIAEEVAKEEAAKKANEKNS